ncbi:MAG TPA: HlyD family efflux transporter periplasmic adaptor subunit [Anaerolineales bacterium]|jgi:HlyD family secretion protein
MQHKRPPVPVIVLVILSIVAAAYYGLRALNPSRNGALQASGSIEAVEVGVSPILAGRVSEVLVDEGQAVHAGDTLLRMDDALLGAQRDAAAAAVDAAHAAMVAAQVKYDQTLQAALTAQAADSSGGWRFSAPDEFNQPAWYFAQAEQLAAARAEVEAASAAREAATTNLAHVSEQADNAGFLAAEKRLADARAAFLIADQVKKAADNAGEGEGGGLQDAAYTLYNNALAELRAAQREYNALLNSTARKAVLDARGQVAVAQQRYDLAQARLASLQTGAESPAVVSAQKALDQATAAHAQAEANLALLNVQLDELTITAPMDGVILTRNAEPGEFAAPGATLFRLAQLNDLTITVYVSEDRLNEVTIGQKATVLIDAASGPRPTYSATVVRISEKAEFTPRNVQTVEGRSSTVYAVELKVDQPDGKLKIGMPADVTFTR